MYSILSSFSSCCSLFDRFTCSSHFYEIHTQHTKEGSNFKPHTNSDSLRVAIVISILYTCYVLTVEPSRKVNVCVCRRQYSFIRILSSKCGYNPIYNQIKMSGCGADVICLFPELKNNQAIKIDKKLRKKLKKRI